MKRREIFRISKKGNIADFEYFLQLCLGLAPVHPVSIEASATLQQNNFAPAKTDFLANTASVSSIPILQQNKKCSIRKRAKNFEKSTQAYIFLQSEDCDTTVEWGAFQSSIGFM